MTSDINKTNLVHNEKLNQKKIFLLNIISFFFGFGLAISTYVYSFYFQTATGDSNISNFYLASYAIFLIAILNLHKLIKGIGKSFSLYLFLFLKLLALTFIIFLEPSFLGSLSLIAYIIFGNIAWVNINIVLETYSTDKMSGRIRGLFMTIANTGFLFGPFISMQVFDKFNFVGVFLIILVIDLLILAISIFSFNDLVKTNKKSYSVASLIKRVQKRKNILRIYYISFVLCYFYATMVMYMPLYLTSEVVGMTIKEIGTVFTYMLIPFILLQYPVGQIADKKMGEKEMLIFAIMVMALSCSFIFFIDSKSLIIWSIVLFGTRIGAAIIEILRDSYFFKRVDGDDVGIIDFFNTAKPVAYSIFALISGILLQFLEIKTVFLLLVLVVISGLYPAFRLEDNLSEEELQALNEKQV